VKDILFLTTIGLVIVIAGVATVTHPRAEAAGAWVLGLAGDGLGVVAASLVENIESLR
jgi:hypothetical protein